MAEIRISLAAARVNAKMTQEEVAAKLEVGKKTVGNWENGRVKPKAAVIYMLSKLYGIPVDAFLLPDKST